MLDRLSNVRYTAMHVELHHADAFLFLTLIPFIFWTAKPSNPTPALEPRSQKCCAGFAHYFYFKLLGFGDFPEVFL